MIYKTAYTRPISTNDTFLESSGKDLSILTYLGLISWVILTLHLKIGLIKLFEIYFLIKILKIHNCKISMKSCSYSKVSPISEDLVAIKVDTSAGAVLELGGQCYDGRRDAIDNFHSVGHVALCERDRTVGEEVNH